jgi:hypothetical protein
MPQLDVQYYFVRSPQGYLSLWRLNATPKLYTLGGAKAVARRRSRPVRRFDYETKQWVTPLQGPLWEVVPVSLSLGTPVSF